MRLLGSTAQARLSEGMGMQNAADWSRARWAQFRRDVWDDASISPVAGIMLSVLAALIVWLTIEYAPGAAERAEQTASATKRADEGVIEPFWGNVTIVLMTIATLTAGFEPIVGRRVERWWRRAGKRWWSGLSLPVRWVLITPLALTRVLAKLASCAWSFIDYILARPIAILAGSAWRGWFKRYTHFVVLMVLAVGACVAAEVGRLAPDFALAAILAGLTAILAIVRRWSWIENDRDIFLIERGTREDGKGTLRVGFEEDLRDEALFALTCLFFLIPMGLDLVQQTTSVAGAPAFAFDSDGPMPREPWSRFITWLGYFGAELAKTVPFVDWSEVFHVANGSPVEAQTPFGSQLVFVLRAGLDLLFLAAVLQAVQISTRLREQALAFRNNRLPILEPFAERVELARAFEQINDDLALRPSAQPPILDFPRYDATRLKELVEGPTETKYTQVRMAAAALLQKTYEDAPEDNSDTERFWTERCKTEPDPDYRSWLLKIASGLDPDEPETLRDPARRGRLLKFILEDWNEARSRTAAIQTLGRTVLSDEERHALVDRLSSDKEVIVRAASALTLAKAGVGDAKAKIEALSGLLPAQAIVAAQMVAHALAHFEPSLAEIISRFPESHREHARAAALIQRTPMGIGDARARNRGAASNQTVAITPGKNGIEPTFLMGSAENDPQAFASEYPQRLVKMTRNFAIGRFEVTQAEYLSFSATVNRPPLPYVDNPSWPACDVNFYDALAYCSWLRTITGEPWRLPTETEWEYGCRAGTASAYWWGDEPDSAKANSSRSQLNRPSDVGSYEPNPWGLWDMHGNILEWCADPWHDDYTDHPPVDHQPRLEGGQFSWRVLRGGSWGGNPELLRSAGRSRYEPALRDSVVGFRVARTITGP